MRNCKNVKSFADIVFRGKIDNLQGSYSGPCVYTLNICLLLKEEVRADRYTYGAYGEPGSHTGTNDTPFRYNGRDGVMTDSNGLYYMRARYYLPETLRFINVDTLKGTIQDSTTLNYYAYVNGNPISLVDPLGMSSEPGTDSGDSTGLVDITARGTTILHKNRNEAYAQRITGDIGVIVGSNLFEKAGVYLSRYIWFYFRVRQGAVWDYKVQSIWEANFPNVKYFGMDNKRYRFNGEEICPTDFGNINFGYAGSALGIPSDVLLVFAGVFELKDHHGYSFTKAVYSAVFEKGIDQWYGDQKDDFEKSTWGISLFYSGY